MVIKKMIAKTKKPTALRAVFYRNLTQALKTKTGAVQTQAVKRIFYLAVRDLPDEVLADLSLQLDYTPRGMTPAFYVNSAEALILKLVEHQTGGRGAGLAWLGRHADTDEDVVRKTKSPQTMKSVLAKMALT